MASLTVDEMHGEFLKNFLTETVYLVQGDAIPVVEETPAVQNPAASPPVVTPAPVVSTQEVPVLQKPVAALPKIPKVESVLPKAFEIIGENRKGVAVLVTLPLDDFKKLPQLEFLNKILAAIGLQPTDVAFVNNVSGRLAQFEELTQALEVNYIISFASRVETDLPHDKFTLYKPVVVGEIPIVFSQALAVLDKDVEHKKLLWGALKQVFL